MRKGKSGKLNKVPIDSATSNRISDRRQAAVPKREFQGRFALITGGSRGIGRAVAIELASVGVDIAINYLKNEEAAQQVADHIRKLGRKVFLVRGNVAASGEVQEMFTELGHKFKKLDYLIHCASLGALKPLRELTDVQLSRSMAVNSSSFVVCAREATKLMRDGGVIIGISSLGSQRFVTNYGAVGIAKASLEAAVRYLSVELASQQIRVNAISGGPIDTEGLKQFPDYGRRKKECIRLTPYGRMGSPQDVANVVRFLCSQDASWICGQTIVVDGGLSLRLLSL